MLLLKLLMLHLVNKVCRRLPKGSLVASLDYLFLHIDLAESKSALVATSGS